LIINNQLWDKQTTQTTPQAIEIRQGITSLYLTPPLASDARGATTSIQYTVENRQNKFYLTVKTPYTWLMNETRVYPVHIDPTIILDYTKILWDGGVSYATESDATWGRYSMGTTIGVGDTNLSPTPGYAYARADMDWDTTSIPDDAGIQDMLLYLYFEFVDPTNDDIRVYPMAGGNNFYPNTDEGNNAFYDDMGDGAQFTNKSVINNFNIFNITNASQDLQTFLSNGVNNWSIGLRAEESGDVAANASYFTSSEGTNVFRPLLIVTYSSFANEATGDSAIRQGIQNALGTNFLVYHETQLYIQNTTIQHQLGRFDEIAVSTNSAKYWNINYVTQGESFTHMNNLTSVVYVLELSNLTSTQITQRVETFIQGTV
ncbi:MAG: hypothetical protein Q8L34_05465, partial [Candidatus Woesearchaeota archaeon]|nr:hypothetical protein [Candidatus Woesearchaeota archaeon]